MSTHDWVRRVDFESALAEIDRLAAELYHVEDAVALHRESALKGHAGISLNNQLWASVLERGCLCKRNEFGVIVETADACDYHGAEVTP